MSKSLNAKLEDFYPRSPCGERPGCQRPCERPTRDFYPRSPCGERRPHGQKHIYSRAFLSTLSLRRATAINDLLCNCGVFLSTLSLRRATPLISALYKTLRYFYPRSPCGERPRCNIPLRVRLYFYPRSPCGERRSQQSLKACLRISIHALLAESDGQYPVTAMTCKIFLSTLSLRRATDWYK